jgi:hypothetical protein
MSFRLILRSLLLLYLLSLTWFLLTGYHPERPGYDPPFVIFVIDTINLFIHEAGHLFFKPFGMWLHIIAGSLFQVLVPCALVVVTYREKPHQLLLPGFWLGESMVNVSAYIQDAPYMKLRLIARGLVHDWNYLIGGNETTASVLGWSVYGAGLGLILGAAVWEGILIVRALRTPEELPE